MLMRHGGYKGGGKYKELFPEKKNKITVNMCTNYSITNDKAQIYIYIYVYTHTNVWREKIPEELLDFRG